jgi:hypothetical protein
MKTSKLFSIVCLASALAFAGCKKKEAAPTGDPAMATKPAEPGAAPTTPPAAPAAPEAPAAAPAAAVTIASDDAYVTQASAMLDKMIDVVKTAGTDCDKLADGIVKMATDNGAQMKALQAYETEHPEAKKKLDEASKDKTKAFEEAAGPAMTACQNNTKVSDAFSKLGG